MDLKKIIRSRGQIKDDLDKNPLTNLVKMAMVPEGDMIYADKTYLKVDKILPKWIVEAKRFAKELAKKNNLILVEFDADSESIAITTTPRKVKDSTSPQMDELIEAFENMPDGEDEIIVETSSEVPQKEIDEFVKAYMRHNPPGEEEFKLTIESLGGNRYKISCPYVGE